MAFRIHELEELVHQYRLRALEAAESSNKFALDIEADAKLIVQLADELIKMRKQFGATAD